MNRARLGGAATQRGHGTPGRNEACPCGSGRRYKDCHGSLAGGNGSRQVAPPRKEDAPRIRDAAAKHRAGDYAGALAIAQAILKTEPANVDALHAAALATLECGRIDQALALFLAGAKAGAFASPPPRRLWADLNIAFGRALSGVDSALAAERRARYAEWLARRRERVRAHVPTVAVVVTVTDFEQGVDRALASVQAQTHRASELIIADGRSDAHARERLAAEVGAWLPRPRILGLPGAAESALIDAGVRAATSEYINVLTADDEFAPERLERLIEHIALRNAAWGFAGVKFVDSRGAPAPTDRDDPAEQPLSEIVTSFDTVGSSFIHRRFVAVAAGNLFFHRGLFAVVGGMRGLKHAHAWDFCLRALWHEEPVYVPAPLYQRCVPDGKAAQDDSAHVEQHAAFREFYARAGDSEAHPPNPFAPCVQYWSRHFYKAPFAAAHAALFGLDGLEAIAAQIRDDGRTGIARQLAPGIDLVGFAFAELGLGESLRSLAHACLEGGIPFSVRDVDVRMRTRQIDCTVSPHVVRSLSRRCAVFCVNPDMMNPVLPLLAAASAAASRVVGYWYWELEDLPREWLYALDRVDELWAGSIFVAEAMRRSTAKPVVKIPPAIELAPSRPWRRSDFGLPEDRFLFLFTFDFNSFVKRKNPQGAIAAFKRAFGARRDVGLVIKSTNGALQPERLRALQAFIDGDERVMLKDEFLTREELLGLQSVVDAFVSLHRAEGFGLGLAESMYLGKPAIGTAYSGNLEFMSESNSCLVDFELVPVGEGEYLYADAGRRWAEPDVEHAASHMRRLVDDPAFRARIASAGQRDMRSRFSRAATATLIRSRLAELDLI